MGFGRTGTMRLKSLKALFLLQTLAGCAVAAFILFHEGKGEGEGKRRRYLAVGSTVKERLEKVGGTFAGRAGEERLSQLMFWAKRLPPMPSWMRGEENKVRGCVSNVRLKVVCAPQGSRRTGAQWCSIHAASDSVLTRGLAALLVHGLKGASLAELASLQPEEVAAALGVQYLGLTPSRNNGFLSMVKHIRESAGKLTTK